MDVVLDGTSAAAAPDLCKFDPGVPAGKWQQWKVFREGYEGFTNRPRRYDVTPCDKSAAQSRSCRTATSLKTHTQSGVQLRAHFQTVFAAPAPGQHATQHATKPGRLPTRQAPTSRLGSVDVVAARLAEESDAVLRSFTLDELHESLKAQIL